MKSNKRISSGKRGGTAFRTPSVQRFKQSGNRVVNRASVKLSPPNFN